MPLKRQPQRPRMARANRFDPSQSATSMIDPAARLAQISAEWEQNPGRAPGGYGNTGLLANDSAGYSQMLGQQQEYMKLQDFMGGGSGEVTTRYGGEYDPIRGGLTPATGDIDRGTLGSMQTAGMTDSVNGIRAATRLKAAKEGKKSYA